MRLPAAPITAFFVLLGLFVFAASQARAASESAPVSVVEGFHGQLLAVMKKAEALGVRGRFAKLEPEIAKAFDLERMIRVAAGRFWRRADDKSRDRVLEAFARMSVATYASQFDGWSGQAFETVGQRPGPQQTMLVETKITDPGGDNAGLTYVLKEKTPGGGDWRIVDVLLDNSISQLAVRRSEYQRVLRTDGLEGLVAILDAKTSDLLRE